MQARRLTLYVRRGCSLCEDMRNDLALFSEELQFALDIVDIDEDPGLRARHDVRVPVLEYANREVCNYFLDPVALRSALAAE
ncbi:MAG: glutaredoxin family protein [Gammaproteobacteria bacterium]|nr:glutaredoxin family protein [Gammaproteobacteria bacterium]